MQIIFIIIHKLSLVMMAAKLNMKWLQRKTINSKFWLVCSCDFVWNLLLNYSVNDLEKIYFFKLNIVYDKIFKSRKTKDIILKKQLLEETNGKRIFEEEKYISIYNFLLIRADNILLIFWYFKLYSFSGSISHNKWIYYIHIYKIKIFVLL